MSDQELKTALDSASTQLVQDLQVDSLRSLSDDVVDKALQNLIDQVNGHAVALWLHEQKAGADVLTIAHNVGEKGPEIEGIISQPTDEGLVSKAFKEKQTICHQGIFKHKDQSSTVDTELGQITAHQIAAPLCLFNQTIGAITVIQTLASGIEQHSEWGFDETDIQHFDASVQIIQRLLELNIIRKLVGSHHFQN